MIYALDTNVLVDALRHPKELERLKAFLTWALPATVLSSIVATELTAGARAEETRQLLDDSLLPAFDRRGRIIPPSATAWRRTGELLAVSGATTIPASRQNDILFAAQARERGWIVVTRDRDFDTLRSQIKGLRVTSPYPGQP